MGLVGLLVYIGCWCRGGGDIVEACVLKREKRDGRVNWDGMNDPRYDSWWGEID